ncbi:hypothetical protein [Streptomyces sp. NPDC018031]|uniref:hypothetical protein n=1 Tax=Streptomyces sp. NPDC018031 TaxID=3365033 RepID=UPI0037A9DFB3
MDPKTVAAEAIRLLFQQVTGHPFSPPQNVAVNALRDLIDQALGAGGMSQEVLRRLEGEPNDGNRQAAVTVLAAAAQQDPRLAEALDRTVRNVHALQFQEGSADHNAVPGPSRNTHKILGIAAALVLLLGGGGYALHATRGGDDGQSKHRGGAAEASDKPGNGDGFAAGAHQLIAASCTDEAVTLIAVDPDTGRRTGTRTFTIPEDADVEYGPPDQLAMTRTGGCPGRGEALRQLFDASFERMAVSISAADGGYHVGYLTATGKLRDLTGSQGDGFSARLPRESGPVFDRVNDQIWFYDYHKGIRARSASTGRLVAAHESKGLQLLQGHRVGANLRTASDGNFVLNPSRTAVSSAIGALHVANLRGTTAVAHEMRLTDRGQDGCSPEGWVDDKTVLCAKVDLAQIGLTVRNDNVFLLTFSSDYSSIESTSRDLLPTSDRDIFPLALSPDRRELLFSARRSGEVRYYRAELVPGATPRELPRMKGLEYQGTINGDADTHPVIAWQ